MLRLDSKAGERNKVAWGPAPWLKTLKKVPLGAGPQALTLDISATVVAIAIRPLRKPAQAVGNCVTDLFKPRQATP